jgi:hypothetical protein
MYTYPLVEVCNPCIYPPAISDPPHLTKTRVVNRRDVRSLEVCGLLLSVDYPISLTEGRGLLLDGADLRS